MRILRKWLRRWLGIEAQERQIAKMASQIAALSSAVEHLLTELPSDEVRRLRWEKRRDTTFRTARRQFLQRKGDI